MEYRFLGKSDLHISRIGFGTMSLEPDSPASESFLIHALDQGINYFDTADIYQQGRSETMLGRAFREKRKQVVLATKVGNRWKPDGSGLDWVPTKKYILNAVEQSLVRLQTEYIDLYQLHGGTMEDPMDEIIEAFEMLKTAGRIRFYGISSIRPNVIREYVKRSSLTSVMMQYSLLDRRPEEEMLSFLHENQVGVLARGTIAKGLLISKPPVPFLNYTTDEVSKAASAIKSVSDDRHEPLDTALRFVLHHPSVSAAVVGIRTKEQLEGALAAGKSPDLNTVQMELLQKVLPVNTYAEHR